MCRQHHIAIAALGTRGDVQPLFCVAWQLAHALEASSTPAVTLITHAAHEAWLRQLLGPTTAVQLLWLASSPAGVWQQQQQQQEKQQHHQGGDGGSSAVQQPQAEQGARQQLLQHCCTALGVQHAGLAKPPAPTRLLIFSMFALEGFHIAEALQVPCLVLQPYLIPYTLPATFARRFARACPGLAAALQHAAKQPAAASDSVGAPVSWKDVSAWMWPLWTERWGAWRQEGLGLGSAWPLLQAWQEGWQGCTFKGTQQESDDAHDIDGMRLPASVPVLYGLSPSVVVRPGYWPASVQLTGFWLASDLHQQQQWQQQHPAGCQLPAALQGFLQGEAAACVTRGTEQQQQQQQGAAPSAAAGGAPAATAALAAGSAGARSSCALLLVDFGSMGLLGLLRDASMLVAVVAAALAQLGWRGVLLTGGWAPLQAACAALGPAERQRLFVQHEPLACHHLLLESVQAVLHHGGSGTTAAALAAGTPQLLCPLQFDQFTQAEHVADLGCSPSSPLTAEQLMPGDSSGVRQAAALLAAQVQAAQHPQVLACCRSLQQAIAAERGLHTAAGMIHAQLVRQADALHHVQGLGHAPLGAHALG